MEAGSRSSTPGEHIAQSEDGDQLPPNPGGGAIEGAMLAAAVAGVALLVVADLRDRIGLGLLATALLAVVCWLAWFSASRRYSGVVNGVVATVAVALFVWMLESAVALAIPWTGVLLGMAASTRRSLRLATLAVLTTLIVLVLVRS